MADNSNVNTPPIKQPAVVQPNKANTLLVGGRDVVVFAEDGCSNIWAKSFVAAQPQARRLLLMADNPQPADALKVIQQAAQMAGAHGRVIFLVGHGGSDQDPRFKDPKIGLVQLAPNGTPCNVKDPPATGTVNLGGANENNVFHDVFYDVNLTGPPGHSQQENDQLFNSGTAGAKLRAANFAIYLAMGTAFRNAQVYKVTFLTCVVGNAIDFIKKIANDWGVIIEAPKPLVFLAPQQNGNVRAFLQGDAPGKGTNIPESEHEVPLLTDANSYRVGPPLPSP